MERLIRMLKPDRIKTCNVMTEGVDVYARYGCKDEVAQGLINGLVHLEGLF